MVRCSVCKNEYGVLIYDTICSDRCKKNRTVLKIGDGNDKAISIARSIKNSYASCVLNHCITLDLIGDRLVDKCEAFRSYRSFATWLARDYYGDGLEL